MEIFRSSVVALLLGSSLIAAQSSAKALFHEPWVATPRGDHPVGIRYWFRNSSDLHMSENRAANIPPHDLELRIRSNTAGFITVWDLTDQGPVQLTSQDPDPKVNGQGRWNGVLLASEGEYLLPGKFRFAAAERRLAVVFSRSQSEQPHSSAEVMPTLARHAALKARDGLPMLIRDVEEFAPERVGTYVVSREGAPVSAEIVLRNRLKRP